MATFREDLRQRDLEAYEEAINTAGIGSVRGSQRVAGIMVRGAITAGWFTDLSDPAAVAGMTGKEVRALRTQVDDLYEELTTVDPL